MKQNIYARNKIVFTFERAVLFFVIIVQIKPESWGSLPDPTSRHTARIFFGIANLT